MVVFFLGGGAGVFCAGGAVVFLWWCGGVFL